MAEFPNNQFSRESNAEHMLRVNLCVDGMTAHPEVEFRGDLVLKMTTHRDDFESLENQHAAEWGDEQAATAYTNLCEDALAAKLSSARYLIQSMIEEEELVPVKANELRRDFGVEGSKPRDRDGMIALGKKMVETNARLVTELSPYALPEAFFVDLETKTGALYDAIKSHEKELNERLTVGEAKQAERDRGDVLLSNAFKWLVALYGEDANILLEFGFTPKSQIWTPGSGGGEQPENWDDPLTGFIVKEGPPGVANVSVNLHEDADGIRIYVAEGPLGDDNQPEMPLEPVEPQVPQPYFLPISAGVRSWIWICAVKDGVEGPISGPLWIEPTL